MNLKPPSPLVKNSQRKPPHHAYVDLDEATDEGMVHITNLRQVQSVRAIAAEAEYVNLRTRVNHLQKELSQLKAQTRNELNQISCKKIQVRQDLTMQHQKTSNIQHWHESEKGMNREAEQHNHRISDFCGIVQETTDAMLVASDKNLYTNRRLLKIEEALKSN